MLVTATEISFLLMSHKARSNTNYLFLWEFKVFSLTPPTT